MHDCSPLNLRSAGGIKYILTCHFPSADEGKKSEHSNQKVCSTDAVSVTVCSIHRKVKLIIFLVSLVPTWWIFTPTSEFLHHLENFTPIIKLLETLSMIARFKHFHGPKLFTPSRICNPKTLPPPPKCSILSDSCNSYFLGNLMFLLLDLNSLMLAPGVKFLESDNRYHITQFCRIKGCGGAPPPPPPIIFERLKLPQQIIYRRKGNLSESPNHQKYWGNVLISRFYEQFSRSSRI